MRRLVAVLVLAGQAIACRKLSENVVDDAAGMNGGFESVKSGLPANWNVYSPKTIPNGDYDLVSDSIEFKEGKRSLKFVVRAAEQFGGWRSPGFSQEFDAPAGSTWYVGFWARNDGSTFVAKVSGVSESSSQTDTIAHSNDPIAAWTRFDDVYTVPPGFNRIRFELNVVRPGTFWIDDVSITRAEPKP